MNDTTACRHCQGLVAGKANRCHHCKRWLRRDSYTVSGRQYMPGPGVYHIFIKQRNTFATHNPTIIWEYMVTFTYGPNGGGIGFHEIPWQYGAPVQTEAQLGQFLSGQLDPPVGE